MPRGAANPSKHSPIKNEGVDWEAVKLEYVTTHMTMEGIATKYKVRGTAARDKARKEKWEEERQAYRAKFQENAQQSKIDVATVKITQWNEETLLHAGLLREAARRQFQYQTSEGWRFKEAAAAKDISAAAAAYVASDKLARLALGASTENVNNTNKALPATVEDFF